MPATRRCRLIWCAPAVAKGKKARTSTLATFSSTVAKRRTQVRFWLGASAASKVRSAKSVVLSVSQQYDSPSDGDNLYENNYVSTVDLKGSMPAEVPGGRWRDCSGVKIEPRADLSNCYLRGANLPGANLTGGRVCPTPSIGRCD